MSDKSVFRHINDRLTTVRVFTMNVLFVLLVILVLVLLASSSGGVQVPSGGALVLNPKGVIVDQASVMDPLQELLSPRAGLQEVPLGRLVLAIDSAAGDERIRSLVLDLGELEYASTAQADALGAAVAKFRAAGKEVVAFGNYFSQPQFLVASFADAVYMHPHGQILLPGFGINRLYFSELVDKLDVNIHIFRVGKYKEFVEPYTRNNMSDEARQANQELVDGLWTHYRARILENRALDGERFDRYVQDFAALLAETEGDMARLALEYHLVDELLTPDQVRARIADRVGHDDAGGFKGIDFRGYLRATGASPDRDGDKHVAVITAQGPIVMGNQARGVIAADSMTQLIRKAREDDDVAALVMRVNSPGGSAFASELIRQELELTQLAGKPVVVSMSDVAASGGYWISATADRIFARPTTITGSIGIFGLFPSFERSLAEIGVGSDGVGTTPLSLTLSPYTGLNEPISRILQLDIENGYERFINLVARGRDMSPEAVDAVAQGRVWAGDRALALGLVDALGGLPEAIASAAELAGLEEYGVRDVTVPLSPQELLMQRLGDQVEVPRAHPLVQALGSAWALLNTLNDPGHGYALCEVCLFAPHGF